VCAGPAASCCGIIGTHSMSEVLVTLLNLINITEDCYSSVLTRLPVFSRLPHQFKTAPAELGGQIQIIIFKSKWFKINSKLAGGNWRPNSYNSEVCRPSLLFQIKFDRVISSFWSCLIMFDQLSAVLITSLIKGTKSAGRHSYFRSKLPDFRNR
jgi:hypothetical protein